MMMQLTLLVSTMNSRVLNNTSLINLPLEQNLRMVIVNQIKGNHKPLDLDKPFLKIINTNSEGLSKSRNIAISSVSNGIALIADDDVVYRTEFFEVIRKAFMRFEDHDLLAFKVLTDLGRPFKKYPDHYQRLNLLNVLNVNSISLAFRVENLKQRKVLFDERFGLGANYVSGEESIFVTDALKENVKAGFIPEYVVIHPIESSGRKLNAVQLKSKGAMFKRIYGLWGWVFSFLFCVKKRKIIKANKINFLEALFLVFSGHREFKT